MPEDNIDKFIALPHDRQIATLQKLTPDLQAQLLSEVKERRTKHKSSATPQQNFSAPPEERNFHNYASETIRGVGRGLKNDVQGLGALIHPIKSSLQMADQINDAGRAAAKEFTDTKGVPIPQRAVAAALTGLEQAPIIGGMVQHAEGGGTTPGSPESIGAAAEGLATFEAPKIAGEMIPPTVRGVRNFFDNGRQAGVAHTAVLADVGGDYIPREQSEKTLPAIRNRAAANPGKVAAINSGDPETALAAHISIIDDEIRDRDKYVDQHLQPIKNYPVDTRTIRGKFVPSGAEYNAMSSAEKAQIRGLEDRIDNAQSIEDLNALRIKLGDEAFAAKNMAEEPSPGYKSNLTKAANAVRGYLYDTLKNATGKDFTEFKRTEGALREERSNLTSKQAKLSQEEVKATTKLPREHGADIVSTVGHGGSPGLPIVSAAAEKMRGTELGRIQSHLKKVYGGDLGAHVPPTVPGGIPTPAGFLPRTATSPLRPGLPASTIANGEHEVYNPDINRPSTQPYAPPGYTNYSSSGYMRPGEPGQVITPSPPGQFLRLPEKATGPISREQVGPQGPQYPALNTDEAVTRVTPRVSVRDRVRALPGFAATGQSIVDPDGSVSIVYKRLPVPATRGLLPAEASAATRVGAPQFPPVGYTIPGENGTVGKVVSVKDGNVVIKWSKPRPGSVLPKVQ